MYGAFVWSRRALNSRKRRFWARAELWNRDTGELLCRSIARYGTGNEIFNEANYVAIPPCLWGFQPGLQVRVNCHSEGKLSC